MGTIHPSLLLTNQVVLLVRRNLLLKRRRLLQQSKAFLLPILVFLLIYLLYHNFPDLVGALDKVEEWHRIFDDDSAQANTDDLESDTISGHYVKM